MLYFIFGSIRKLFCSMESDKTYFYSSNDLIEEPVSWSENGTKLSNFDKRLRNAWDKAVGQGLFRYTLSDCVYKPLCLKNGGTVTLPCMAQLNPQRAVNRRKRECFDSMNDPFDESQFNFTKIRKEEILFELSCENGQTSKIGHHIILNISPIEYGHILFAPFLKETLPQRCTITSLLSAFDVIQLSSQPSFRLGFNSLHAWASINHLHFHGMYCNHELFGDVLPAEEHLASSCYLIHSSSPIPAFVFTIPKETDRRLEIAKGVAAVTDILHKLSVPYNIVINRGKLLKSDGSRSDAWVSRTLIFPRKSSKGCPPADPFDVACIEVGGHFPVKTKESFDSLTAETAFDVLKAVRLDDCEFENIKKKVKNSLTLL